MARREDHHQQRQIQYATILPSNTPADANGSNDSPSLRKQTELERAKALYVDFEDAFQDDTTNHDYFGLQSHHPESKQNEQNSHQPTNFYLQSIETISEVKNANFSPFVRHHASRESSRPSTPSDTPPYQPKNNHRANPLTSLPSSSQNHHSLDSNGMVNLQEDFANLNLMHTNDIDDLPAPFTPDAIRIQITQNDHFPTVSSQFKLILPQYFLVKYLGRAKCPELWGSTAVRAPIDDMVSNARKFSSMNEMPTLDACINTRGLTLTHRQSSTRSKHDSHNHSPEGHQSGLIPLEYISYVMHDIKYSKISACIVLRQPKTSPSSDKKNNHDKTLTECYAFLFQSKEHAHRFALSLSEAFNSQKHSSKGSKQNHDDRKGGRSPQRRLKHRSHHHEKIRGKYDDSYLRDSEV
ncbi:unnamed protein product [Rotaria socialis]|uniref:Uncharacterized protein n=1 Tax=Rotaria socialis TaxID=392032 RepID=A0A818Y961_9BILA|nr:unnamed protein product [Rotaria socialis]CAF3344479.1 unnamed protein product [Rotaria socialis]CAF3347419.1 unnamed protein product [Rotaria socialis]CAF3443312.1 unnamed protein product [Rotaria socialis]CAF3747763.1 unnamed protein product [Rotaria socialis]